MTMIDQLTIYAGSTAVYAVALVVLLAWLRRVPADRRDLCYPIVLVVAASVVALGVITAGFGTVSIGETDLVYPQFLNDLFAYGLLFAVMARLADLDGRPLAIVVGTPVAQLVAFQLGVIPGGLIALLSILFVVGAQIALIWYLFGPIWERAQAVPEQRRLLHWKARNLLLFLTSMLLIYAVLAVAGVFDAFVLLTIDQYMGVLNRLAFAGFLFANLDAVGDVSLRPSSPPEATPAD